MSSKRKRLCIVCRERPPVVPDRDSMSSAKRVCRECHEQRLRGDLATILYRPRDDR